MLGVALGILVQVYLPLERAVVARNQCFSLLRRRRVALQSPVLWVVLRQRPAHDVQAFFEHSGTGIQYRHRALG